jgi:hypothetical protein
LDVDEAPREKGTTADAEDGAGPLPADGTVTWVAVIVVLSVVPRTRTDSPVVTILAEAGAVPFW